MGYRFANQNNPKKTLWLSSSTWFSLLDTAEQHGWNPMGTVYPEWWMVPEGIYPAREYEYFQLLDGSYTGAETRLVMLEDALNLADALERAISAYEPRWTRFQEWGQVSLSGVFLPVKNARPSLGALSYMLDLCRLGAFCIENTC